MCNQTGPKVVTSCHSLIYVKRKGLLWASPCEHNLNINSLYLNDHNTVFFSCESKTQHNQFKLIYKTNDSWNSFKKYFQNKSDTLPSTIWSITIELSSNRSNKFHITIIHTNKSQKLSKLEFNHSWKCTSTLSPYLFLPMCAFLKNSKIY